MRMIPFREEHLVLVAESWNRWVESQFAVDQRLLQQLTFAHPSWERERSTLAFENGTLRGFILARDSDVLSTIDALIVDPDYRRRGLGSDLVCSLGPKACRFGGGPAHFVPGIPIGWEAARAFLESLGFRSDWEAEDLYLRLSSRDPVFTSCLHSEKRSLIEMVKAEFSQRWTNDSIARFDAGDARDIMIIKKNSHPVAFCHTWHYRSALLGPSTYWLRNSCSTFGGIGPVGVVASERGLGLGREIVVQALNYLNSVGVTEVVVDWTAIGSFYEKCGFESWRKYIGYVRGATNLL